MCPIGKIKPFFPPRLVLNRATSPSLGDAVQTGADEHTSLGRARKESTRVLGPSIVLDVPDRANRATLSAEA